MPWLFVQVRTMHGKSCSTISQTTEVSRRLDFTVCSCVMVHHVVSFYQELVYRLLQTVDSGNHWQHCLDSKASLVHFQITGYRPCMSLVALYWSLRLTPQCSTFTSIRVHACRKSHAQAERGHSCRLGETLSINSRVVGPGLESSS